MTDGKELVRDDLPYVLMDKADEQQIIAELKGAVLDKFVYHFNQRGKEIWGLSKAGVDEATREMAKRGEVIRELEESYQVVNDECLFTVKAGRFIVGANGKEVLMETKYGRKRQPLKYEDGRPNPFWFEQAGAKASRNAKLSLIPEELKGSVIQSASSKGQVEEITDQPRQPDFIRVAKQNPDSLITDKQVKRLYAIGHSRPVMDANGKQVIENGKPKWAKRPEDEQWSKEQIELFLQTIKIIGIENIPVAQYNDICDFVGKNQPSVE